MALADLGLRIKGALGSLGSKGPRIELTEVNTILNDIGEALLEADVHVDVVENLKASVRKTVAPQLERAGLNKERVVRSAVEDALVALVDPGTPPFEIPRRKDRTWVVMAVGLQGAGKTTTLMKIAALYTRRRYRVGVVCADTFRAGAFDQLKANCAVARAEFYGSVTEPDPVAIASAGVKQFRERGFDLVLVDTAGRHEQDAALFHEMSVLSSAVTPDHVILIVDGTAGGATCAAQAQAFAARVPIGWFVITKLDGRGSRGGGALSAVAAVHVPIAFLGTGEGKDALTEFRPRAFVRRMLGVVDAESLRALKDDLTGLVDIDEAALRAKIEKGTFAVRDCAGIFESLGKIGNLGSLFGALGPDMAQLGGLTSEPMARLGVIFKSMTKAELDTRVTDVQKVFTAPRVLRIARGSGLTALEVATSLGSCAKIAQVVSATSRLEKRASDGDIGKSLSEMAGLFPPEMMQRLGGMEGLGKLVANLSAAEGGGGVTPQQLQKVAAQMGSGKVRMQPKIVRRR
eukprot:TRINITY_DN23598_c0_g1_i1.p1 TRINITY_DN23598_c0_g1~~TRINITY_DN23598_c0_g1_i1.p1  ORF type:complete len:518 (-),score=148.16 TRINITY_DN23598_c0_g1_i1:22-1575(-)